MGRSVPRVDLHPAWVDVALVGAVVVAATLGLATTEPGAGGPSPLRWALGIALALPLLARRRAPELVLVGITAVAVFQGTVLREMPGFEGFLALLIGAFSVGAHATLISGGLAAMGVCLLGIVVVGAVAEPLSLEGVIIPFVYLGAAWGVGRLVGARTSQAARLATEAERLVREQGERERMAIADERARISRELHDVVAHAVTTMVLQAGAAQAELRPGDAATVARLAAIESSGRQALDELRRVLAVMHDPEGPTVPGPTPTLTDLTQLIERTVALGVEVDLSVSVGTELAPGLSLSVYRIVQEALTNVLKHASATRAWVRISETRGEVVVEVRDDGDGAGTVPAAGGHGLVGMRERAALFGGTLEAGVESGQGGFLVRARLPRPEVRE